MHVHPFSVHVPQPARGVEIVDLGGGRLLWRSGNRDESVFPHGEEVVLDRFPNRHMTFGLGAHRCLGSTLARRQILLALSAVLQRLPDYEIDRDQVARAETIGVAYGSFSLPARFTPGVRFGPHRKDPPTPRSAESRGEFSAISIVAAVPPTDQTVLRKDGDSRKLGEILAERIEDEIVSSGWPIGTVLGSEAELTERYGVSRAVFREAMRIVDHHGVAEMRRGPGGGLVVAAPDLVAIVRAVSLRLHFERIRPGQVMETRNALELECARLAAERIDDEGRQRIQAFLDVEEQAIKETRRSGRSRGDLPSHDFHLLLAELTGNPAIRLFVQITTRVLGEQSPRARSLNETASELHRVHCHIAEAVAAGDAEAAVRRMTRHLTSVQGFFASPAGPSPVKAKRKRTR